MNRLDICISNDDYSVKYGCSAQTTATTGGFDRLYKRTDTKHHVVTCSTLLSEEDYQYFRAFYLDWQNDPQDFICGLVLEGFDYKNNLKQDYLCSFVPDSVMFDLNALHFNVMFQLSVFINPLSALTSKPYRVETIENIESSILINHAKRSDIVNRSADLELLSSSISITGAVVGDLYNRTNSYEFINASISISSAIVSGQVDSHGLERLNAFIAVNKARKYNALISTSANERINATITVNKAILG